MTVKEFKQRVAAIPDGYDNLPMVTPNPEYDDCSLEPLEQEIRDVDLDMTFDRMRIIITITV